MRQLKDTFIENELVKILPKELVVAAAKQKYRSEIEVLLRELRVLLPRHWKSVDPSQYAYDRDEVLALSAACRDTSLDLDGFAVLVSDVKKHRRVLADALVVPPGI